MRTFYRSLAVSFWLVGCAAGMLCGAGAQVLARPGWAGSGVTLEPWWTHAVFYRIDVARFQDSDGDGAGDLRGVAERLDYLQGLGVDALVLGGLRLDGGSTNDNMEAFAELARAATARHLRVLVELNPSDAHVREAARAWLTQGAAGVYVELIEGGGGLSQVSDARPAAPAPARPAAPGIMAAVAGLRQVTDAFPGGRILMAGMSDAAGTAAGPGAAGSGAGSGAAGSGVDAQLVVSEPLLPGTGAAGLRTQMQQDMSRLQSLQTHSGRTRQVLVLRARRVTATAAEDAKGAARASALLLLASRGAVMLEYGEELGLESAPGRADPLMQWTASDVTPKPVAEPKPDTSPQAPGSVYRAFQPYVTPLPRDLFPAPKMPEVVFSDAPPPVPVAMLPGFTTGRLPEEATAANAALANVVAEESDKDSVLQLTRRLLQLRHDDSSLRSGSERFVERDALGALVWVRGVPAGTRTSGTVVAVANLTAVPLYLSLTEAMPGRGTSASVRSLLGTGVQSLGQVRVPAYGVFLGEMGR